MSAILPSQVISFIDQVGTNFDRFFNPMIPEAPAALPNHYTTLKVWDNRSADGGVRFAGIIGKNGSPQELLPPQILGCIANFAAPTMKEWLPLSGIFSTELSAKEVELMVSEKIKALLSECTTLLAQFDTIDNPTEWHEDQADRIRQFSEILKTVTASCAKTTRLVQESTRSKEEYEAQNSILQEALLFPSLKTRLLAFVFMRNLENSTPSQRQRLYKDAETTRRLITPTLSYFERAVDYAMDKPTGQIGIRAAAFAVFILTFLGASLAYYLTAQALSSYVFPYVITPILNSAYCPWIGAEAIQFITGALSWLQAHKILQIFLSVVPIGLAVVKHMCGIKNKYFLHFIYTAEKSINCLPLIFFLKTCIAKPALMTLQRLGGVYDKIWAKIEEEVINSRSSLLYGLRRAFGICHPFDGIDLLELKKMRKTFQTWLDLARYVDQRRYLAKPA